MKKNAAVVFFDALFDRLYKENDLSDITYAMCKTSEGFNRFFLETMFPDELFSFDGHWEREYESSIVVNDKKSRVDFYYEEDGRKYIIENKINDWNTHDEQYSKAYPDCKRAFIANYPYRKQYYDHCETWKSLLKKLKESSLSSDSEEKTILSGYISYLSKVVNYMEAEAMDFADIKSIRSLFILINGFADEKKLSYTKNNKFEYSTIDWLGRYYSDSDNNAFYICLELNYDVPRLGVFVKPGWKNNPAFNKLAMDTVRKKESTFIDKKLFYEGDSDWGVGFFFDSEKWSNLFFGSDPQLEDQKKALEAFLSEVLDLTKTTLSALK